jgi:hypothetical protein
VEESVLLFSHTVFRYVASPLTYASSGTDLLRVGHLYVDQALESTTFFSHRRVGILLNAYHSQCLSQETYTDASGILFTGTSDANADLHLGFLFPAGTTGTEFIGEFVAPFARKWVGLSLGGYMTNAPLIVAWPNANKIVYSTRFTTYGLSPRVLNVLDAEPLA